MRGIFEDLVGTQIISGKLEEDVITFLENNGQHETAEHCLQVARESQELARRFGADPDLAFKAGLLHDVSAVFPTEQRIFVSNLIGIEVLQEEETFPMIMHQKISRIMGAEIFNVEDEAVLSAVSCHTTLKANASLMDKVLFVADKIKWDQKGVPPYLVIILNNLEMSLDHAAFAYINYLWEQRDQLKVIHPWLRDAYIELQTQLK